MKKKIILISTIFFFVILIIVAVVVFSITSTSVEQTGTVACKTINEISNRSNVVNNFENVSDEYIEENEIENQEEEELQNQKSENQNEEEQQPVSNEPETVVKTEPTGNTTYYIKVNYQENTVTIYSKDESGYYTVPVKAMICSCGTATPKSGVYKTSSGYEWGTLEGGTHGRYSTRIKGAIMFHSVPYIEEKEDTLEYWEYDKLGTTASLGCVRLTVADSKWIFDNMEDGTPVEFYADSNPGPLGKPSAQKISDNEECRNWDPTDTSANSPWNFNGLQ